MTEPPGSSAPHPSRERAHAILKALRKHRSRLERRLDAVRGDLAAAKRAPELRRTGEALLAYLHEVPPRATRAEITDPADPSRKLAVELDPRLNAQGNAARYFKQAAKAERALEEIPPRLAETETAIAAAGARIAKLSAALDAERDVTAPVAEDLAKELEAVLRQLPPPLRAEFEPAKPPRPVTPAAIAAGEARAPSAKLQPRRFKTAEGWDVLIGKTNEGNDYLTHTLARPEDYWFHVHGAPGSHVVLRRGKGKNEPSKRTLEEVASWAAFHSQARHAGKVPVIWTRKKYVRKPRKSPPGLAAVEREKMLMVRPVEPKAPEAKES